MTETACALNVVVSLLHQFNVVDLVRAEFAKYNNDTPPQLLEKCIAETEELLKCEQMRV